MLQQAIEEDEQGDKDDAIQLYAKAVEYVTKYPELMQGELRRIALQALDRAETLKGKLKIKIVTVFMFYLFHCYFVLNIYRASQEKMSLLTVAKVGKT